MHVYLMHNVEIYENMSNNNYKYHKIFFHQVYHLIVFSLDIFFSVFLYLPDNILSN
jgi:hypothetical protein